MLTFDTDLSPLTLENLMRSNMPDVHEVGETDIYWVYVKRSTKMMELVSKQTGHTIARCRPNDAAGYGISQGQIDAAMGVLRL